MTKIPICFICSGSKVDDVIKDSDEMIIMDTKPCLSCQKLLDEGNVAVVSVERDTKDVIQMFHQAAILTKVAADDIFNKILKGGEIVYITPEQWDVFAIRAGIVDFDEL